MFLVVRMVVDLKLQHGIQVARELGYRYIWIDALCAIQDVRADWIGQAKLVAQMYGNADLTIVAGRSKDARDGFLAPTYTPSAPPAALHYQPAYLPQVSQHYPPPNLPPLSRCWVSLPRGYKIGYLNGRGWCFQEALVSRRQIIYGEEQLSFQCREEIKFEGGHWETIDRANAWYDLTTLRHYRGQPQSPPEIPRDARDDPILDRWYATTSESHRADSITPARTTWLSPVLYVCSRRRWSQETGSEVPDIWLDCGSGICCKASSGKAVELSTTARRRSRNQRNEEGLPGRGWRLLGRSPMEHSSMVGLVNSLGN